MTTTSPPKDLDVEAADQEHSPDEQEGMEARETAPAFDFEVKEQDRWLPIANVARIMKNALPENAKIAKEAKECMQECVSEFISFITSEASEKCQQEKRKTVNGEDILFAMTSLGFENYSEALKIYLAKYRESQSQRNQSEGGQQGSTSNSGHIRSSSSGGAPPSSSAPSNHHDSTSRTGAANPLTNSAAPHPPTAAAANALSAAAGYGGPRGHAAVSAATAAGNAPGSRPVSTAAVSSQHQGDAAMKSGPYGHQHQHHQQHTQPGQAGQGPAYYGHAVGNGDGY